MLLFRKSRGDPKEIQNTNSFVLRKKVLTFENGTQGPNLGPNLGPILGPNLGPNLGPIFKSQHFFFLKTKDSEQ